MKKQHEVKRQQIEQRHKQEESARKQKQEQELQQRLSQKEKELQNKEMQLQKLQEQQQPEHAGMELRKPDNNLSVTFGGASPASMQSREPKPGQAVEQGLDLLSGSSTPGTRFAQLELELLQLRHLVGQQQQTIATQ